MLGVTDSSILGIKPSLQVYGSVAGGQFGQFLARMKDLGVFDYVLPFLLIFALVFSILSRINITGKNNKGVDSVIAIAVALMSLQFGFVSRFFSEMFPIFGVVLAVLLLVLIIMGFVGANDNTFQKWMFFIFAIVSVLVILFNSLSISGALQGQGVGYIFYLLGNNIIEVLVIIGLIVGLVAVIKGSLGSGNGPNPPNAPAVFYPPQNQQNNP